MSDNQLRSPASVDVAIPCYPYGGFLRDCVTSVLTQAIRDVRVLIIDNASTDDSVEVALQIAAEDPRSKSSPADAISTRTRHSTRGSTGPERHTSWCFAPTTCWRRGARFSRRPATAILPPCATCSADKMGSAGPSRSRPRWCDGRVLRAQRRGRAAKSATSPEAPIPRSHGTYIHGSSVDAL